MLLLLMLFNIYMRPLANLISSCGALCHKYVDDTQLYILLGDQQESALLDYISV